LTHQVIKVISFTVFFNSSILLGQIQLLSLLGYQVCCYGHDLGHAGRAITEAGEFLPPEAGEPPTPPGTGDAVLINGAHYDNPLFDVDDEHLDTDYNNEPLWFRSMSDLTGPAVPPGQVPCELSNSESDRLFAISVEEPTTVAEAVQVMMWHRAMMEEQCAIKENTWELTELPSSRCAIGLKWVFKVKRNKHGDVVRHKVQLVVRAYAQRQGVDFEEVFAPVAHLEAVRLLMALAVEEGWQVHHMDVKTTFLNGELQEEVYVQ
jgi:hypothetical protein